MAIINPEHLLEQADRLIVPQTDRGPPRQVDLRRAISSSYYAVFHFVMTHIADTFVGKTMRGSKRYGLVYRHLNHSTLKIMCTKISNANLPPQIASIVPDTGLGPDIAAFAALAVELQEKRHRADYDPTIRLRTSDAQLAIEAARSAIRRYERASSDRRNTFLTLLLCPPR